jgi:hypothetical protein
MSKSFETIRLVIGGRGNGNYYLLQDRMLGFNIEKMVVPSEVTTFTCEITLDNDDGAFTPNGGGTYSSIDWLNSYVTITNSFINDFSTPTASGAYFWGVVDNIEIIDDGVTSRVELSCIDLLTVASRLPALAGIPSFGLPADQDDIIHLLLTTACTGYYGANSAFPTPPGYTGKIRRVQVSNISASVNIQQDADDVDTSGNAIDALMESILPSTFCVIWPRSVQDAPNPYSGDWMYVYYIGSTGLRSSGSGFDYIAYEFVEGSPTSGQIPFSSIDTGFRLDRLVNSVTATNVSTSTDLEAYNLTSIGKFGARNVNLQTMVVTTDEQAQNSISNLANRFAEPRYSPRSITVEGAAVDFVDDVTTTSNFKTSMEISELWQPVTITYTPRGAASPITERAMITGTVIEAVPGSIRCTYHLLPSVDYESFCLDSTSLGVLDQNRLG